MRSDVRGQALAQADVVAAGANDLVKPPKLPELDELARTSAATVRGRVVILDETGMLLADSAGTGRTGADYSTRPEVKSALGGTPVQVERHSKTLKLDILATAVPIANFGKTVGAVRITQSNSALSTSVRRSIYLVVAVGLVVLVLGLAAGWLLASQISRPLRRLEQVAVDIASGDLDARAAEEGPTEQRNLAIAFNDMTDQLVRMVDSQKQFVADASHQLRTPLAALRLRVEEAIELGDGGEAEAELEAGLKELERIRGIIDDLLMLSRIGERGGPSERIDLVAFVARAAERWAPIGLEKGMVVTAAPAPPWGRRHGECSQADLDRVVDALVENSVRYSPEGSNVALAVENGSIIVTDEGPGLADGEEEIVFERFRRGTAGQAVAHGTGLGLAIARDLMRSWRGDVTLANRDGKGVRATIEVADSRRENRTPEVERRSSTPDGAEAATVEEA